MPTEFERVVKLGKYTGYMLVKINIFKRLRCYAFPFKGVRRRNFFFTESVCG
jgi:hypothetical protein